MSRAVIIGDSTHNTLSAVRSLGVEHIPFTLILKSDDDFCNVTKSKHVRRNDMHLITHINECLPILNSMQSHDKPYIICTFDEAAEFIDKHEEELSRTFTTPCRGKHIGDLFNKDAQCRLAKECGLTVPESYIFNRNDIPAKLPLDYPVILKPLYSTQGEKSDIHICRNRKDLEAALLESSKCERFILQEYIDKDYELNCLGVATHESVIIAGGIKKLRHYPLIVGACSFGQFLPVDELDINIPAITDFLRKSHYHGPFSVEFIHARGQNYFMEVNFRNDGLAYTATKAGINLPASYTGHTSVSEAPKAHQIYMMNYSTDYLHVKEGRISKTQWWRDFIHTRCFINLSPSDSMPVIAYYLKKLHLCR